MTRRGMAQCLVILVVGAALPQGAGAAVQERLLQGVSAEGASVDAYRSHGRITRIVVEAMHEWGYTISEYGYSGAALVTARSRRVGYRGYPDVDMSRVPPHHPGHIDATDHVLSDDTLRFMAGRLTTRRSFGRPMPVDAPDAAELAEGVQAHSRQYLAFMQTPSPRGHGAGGSWVCVPGAGKNCASFKPDGV